MPVCRVVECPVVSGCDGPSNEAIPLLKSHGMKRRTLVAACLLGICTILIPAAKAAAAPRPGSLSSSVAPPPTKVVAIPQFGRISVSWTPASGAAASHVTKYSVVTAPSSVGCSTSAKVTSCVIKGLSNGASYLLVVEATNASGVEPPVFGRRTRGAGVCRGVLEGPGLDMSHKSLSGCDLTFANLSGSNLSGSNLSGAHSMGHC